MQINKEILIFFYFSSQVQSQQLLLLLVPLIILLNPALVLISCLQVVDLLALTKELEDRQQILEKFQFKDRLQPLHLLLGELWGVVLDRYKLLQHLHQPTMNIIEERCEKGKKYFLFTLEAKIFKKILKKFQKIFKNFQKNFKKFQKIF